MESFFVRKLKIDTPRKAYSPIGKELDSLADLVTFGLAPAMLCLMTLRGFDYPGATLATYYPYIGLVLVVFAALRLAKFNTDERQTSRTACRFSCVTHAPS